jgi:hypothetical protein
MNTKTFNPWDVIKHIKPEQWDTIHRALLRVDADDVALARSMWLKVNDLAKSGVTPEKRETASQEVESDGGVMLAALALSRSPERFMQWFAFNGGIGCRSGWGHDWFNLVMTRAKGLMPDIMPIAAQIE